LNKKEKEDIRKQDKEHKEFNRLSSLFHKAFKRNSKKEGKLNKSGVDSSWKWSGYELIDKIEHFSKKNPEIVLSWCDDSFFSNSLIVLIPHRNKNQYLRTEFVIIPQCSGDEPLTIYLSPKRMSHLIEEMITLKRLEEKADVKKSK
jgi:hypothetical protein